MLTRAIGGREGGRGGGGSGGGHRKKCYITSKIVFSVLSSNHYAVLKSFHPSRLLISFELFVNALTNAEATKWESNSNNIDEHRRY
jgi:hypothetical protein